jgi:predicted metallopeptidase
MSTRTIVHIKLLHRERYENVRLHERRSDEQARRSPPRARGYEAQKKTTVGYINRGGYVSERPRFDRASAKLRMRIGAHAVRHIHRHFGGLDFHTGAIAA